jgi:predicted RNA-binding protein YlxR (DUF448 family)/ribosomal protein L30E
VTGLLETSVQQAEGPMSGSRTRRCIVTGEVLPEGRLLRFVVGPGGEVVPDVEAKLPGRGLWLRADKETVAVAAKKQLFSRAAKTKAVAGADLAALAEERLTDRMLGHLGIARRAGELILGFDSVERALRSEAPPAVIVEAAEASAEGSRKLRSAALARGVVPFVIGALTNEELSLAVGRANVVHAALKPGRIAERLIFDAGRLAGFRPLAPWVWPGFTGSGQPGSSLKPHPLE